MPTDKIQAKNDPSGKPSSADAGQDEVQENVDEANEKGYFGTAVDPTPNENYTLQGVVAGKPTPETDADAKTDAEKAAGVGVTPKESDKE